VTSLFRSVASCLLLGVALSAAAAVQDNSAQTILHMLDYVAVDYPEAVQDGKVKNADEYKEMLEFTAQVSALMKGLPENPKRAALVAEAGVLAGMVDKKAPASAIATTAGKLRWAVIGAYKLSVAPKAAPDLKMGAKLYQAMCGACHGIEGRGDGAAGARLDPKPSDFHDRERMAQRSVYGLYNTITLGVAGTGMTAYRQLTEEERWALAFHAANYSASADAVTQGETLWRAGKSRSAFPDIGNVATLSANEVKERYGEEAVAIQAYLRAHPDALAQGKPSPIAFSLQTLEAALAAYRGGDRARAQQLAITAYLEGFELVEASLANVDSKLVMDIEREMMALRSLIARGAPADEVAAQHARTEALLRQAQERLTGEGVSGWAAFVSSFLILLREGLEAILVLAAIIAFLIKSRRRDALPYVHAGWSAALAAGVLTWAVATYGIGLSGANREVTEGVTALLAAAMLIYVGFWLHSKAYAHAWQHFIKEQVGAALGRNTLWAMAAVSFLAVYRELFEIVLFYQALWAQVGGTGQAPVLAGVGAAAVLLALVGWAIFKYSIRLPIGPFFAATSILLALLAVVFAGNGIAALQEAGVMDVDPVAFITLPALGVYPTLQTIAGQLVALAVVIASFYFASRQRTATSDPRTGRPA
jgi:high-affinity iron transporter